MRKDLFDTYAASLPDTNPRYYLSRAEKFLRWLGTKEPSGNNVRKWLDKMRSEKYAAGTIRTEFFILRRLYTVNGLEWPFKKSEAPMVSERDLFAPRLDDEIIKDMVDVVLGRKDPLGDIKPDNQHRAYLALSTVYGMRRIEMLEMCPDFLDAPNSLIFVQTAKRGRQRYHVIPDSILTHLVAWGFKKRMSAMSLSTRFTELKTMVGVRVEEVGWHAVRRSATAAAFEAGLDAATVTAFYRWKRSSYDMAMRYGTAPIVGRNGVGLDLGSEDRKVDERVFAAHPFVRFWE